MELDQSQGIENFTMEGRLNMHRMKQNQPYPNQKKDFQSQTLDLGKKKNYRTKPIPNRVTGGSQSREVIPSPQLILHLALLSATHIIIFYWLSSLTLPILLQ